MTRDMVFCDEKIEPADYQQGAHAGMKDKPWFLYVLECAGDRLYTGITVDIDARFAAHASGKGAKFTKGFPPRRVLFQAEFPDRATASRAESDFKKLSTAEKRHFVRSNTQSGTKHP